MHISFCKLSELSNSTIYTLVIEGKHAGNVLRDRIRDNEIFL